MPAKVQCSQILFKCKLHPVISPHKSLYSFPSAVRIKLNCLAWFSRLTRPGSCQALQARVFLLSSLTHHTLSFSNWPSLFLPRGPHVHLWDVLVLKISPHMLSPWRACLDDPRPSLILPLSWFSFSSHLLPFNILLYLYYHTLSWSINPVRLERILGSCFCLRQH